CRLAPTTPKRVRPSCPTRRSSDLSSGGVVQLWGADGTPAPSLDLRATAGRYGHLAGSARLRGTAGGNGYNVSAQVLDSDGYREHSEARRTSLNARDRKSTRLNSSHVKISYAVFCLKKKNC